MNSVFAWAALLLGLGLAAPAHADRSLPFVRIACVPEAGLFEVEFRRLHESVASNRDGPETRQPILGRAGFHDPEGLASTCTLGEVVYTVMTSQGPTSNAMCGASPDIYLSVTRQDKPLLSDVLLGDSCWQFPSIARITVGDGPQSWRGRETEVCYASGTDGASLRCDWTSGSAAFDKRFPIDQERLRRIVDRAERR